MKNSIAATNSKLNSAKFLQKSTQNTSKLGKTNYNLGKTVTFRHIYLSLTREHRFVDPDGLLELKTDPKPFGKQNTLR